MKVYIAADIEGITGTTHPDETDKKHSDYSEFREQMTAEVTAACEVALEAGANEIWVRDAHWTGRNLTASKLPRDVRLVRGWSGHPFSMMQELDETFDAVLMIGFHSRAGSGTLPLAHTLSGRITYVKINDRYASEFLIGAYTAGLVQVPVVFISGDAGVCREAQAFIPNLSTVAVMEGVGSSTVSIHPRLAVERIRAGAKTALEGDLSKCQAQMPDHFSVEIRYRNHARAYQTSFFPGANLIQPHTVQFEADDYFEVLRFFLFGITLS
jgi:D-amino peptidase